MARKSSFEVTKIDRARCPQRSKRYRLVHKINQAELGDIVACSQKIISRLESGHTVGVSSRVLKAVLALDLPATPDGDLPAGWDSSNPLRAAAIEAVRAAADRIDEARAALDMAVKALAQTGEQEVEFI